jgi:sulfur-carrier protein adenylyltransferase/sulfurtransferase
MAAPTAPARTLTRPDPHDPDRQDRFLSRHDSCYTDKMSNHINSVQASSLRERLDSLGEREFTLVDVRTPQEYENGHIPGAVLLPLSELETRVAELPAGGEIFFYCRSGKRSMAASLLALDSGRFAGATIVNVEGGFSEYEGVDLAGQPRLLALPPDITFRDALLWAMNMEKGAERVYRVLAAEASPQEKAISTLASLERAHARTVFEMLVRQEPGLPSFDALYDGLDGGIIEGGEPVDEALDRLKGQKCLELSELALEIEWTAYDLYRTLASRTDNERFRAALLALAEAEKNHLRTVARIFRDCP